MNKIFLNGVCALGLLFGVSAASQACTTTFDGVCGTISGLNNKEISDNRSYNAVGEHEFSWALNPGQELQSVTLNLAFSNISCSNCGSTESWSVFVSGLTNPILTNVKNGVSSISWDSGDSFFNQLTSSNSLTVWLKEGTRGWDKLNLTSSLDVECSTVPVPAAAPLFMGGMALVGWAGRRRRRVAASAA